jgi:hypothetical protein
MELAVLLTVLSAGEQIMTLNGKFRVMNKTANIIALTVAVVCVHILTGCGSSNSRHTAISDDEILESFRNDTIVQFQWYGNNQWRLDESGWDGGGHAPYDVDLNTDEIHRCAHGELVWDGHDARLLGNPQLLYPLFDSSDTDVVLAALYCYSNAPIHGYMTNTTLLSTTDEPDLGSQLRRLLNEHRDVRVRCMAADMLRVKSFLAIRDVDRMLCDENLSVQIMGIRAIIRIRNGMKADERKVFGGGSRPTEADARSLHRSYYPIKKQLIPILLKHLNDNHFYIRAECYREFRFLVRRRRYLHDGRMTIETPDMPAKRFDWERESWWNCRDQQQKLLSWWQDKGESVLRDYGPQWSESVAAAAINP